MIDIKDEDGDKPSSEDNPLSENRVSQILSRELNKESEQQKSKDNSKNKNVIPLKPGIEHQYIPPNAIPTHSHIKKVFTLYPDWVDVIRYDEYKDELIKFNPTPWNTTGSWTDVDTTRAKVWLGDHFSITYPTTSLDEVLTVIGHDNRVNTLQEEIKSYQWDGIERLDSWLIDIFNVDKSEYHKDIGKKFLLSAIARAMDPGCKADHTLILEGDERFKKSSAIEVLAGSRNYCDSNIDLKSTFSPAQLLGVWFYELPERLLFKSFSEEESRSFISRKRDDYSPKNQKRKVHQQRTNVFVSSCNESVYLTSNWNRRSWPCRVNKKINLDQIYKVREPLIAEALLRYNEFRSNNPSYPIFIDDSKYQWWLNDGMEEIAHEEQELRHVVDTWEEDITAWFAKNHEKILEKGFVTTSEILQKAIGKRKYHIQKNDEMKISKILTERLHWKKGARIRGPKGRIYPFYPPNSESQKSEC